MIVTKAAQTLIWFGLKVHAPAPRTPSQARTTWKRLFELREQLYEPVKDWRSQLRALVSLVAGTEPGGADTKVEL